MAFFREPNLDDEYAKLRLEQDASDSGGACLDDFEIKSILGQGSNGTVYKAYQRYAIPGSADWK